MAQIQKLLAQNLRRLRLDRGLTQQELAMRAGVDRRCIPLLETGTWVATIPLLDKLAHALGVHAAALVVSDEHRAPPPREGEARPVVDVMIGRRVRAIRRKRGLSRKTLAAALGLSRRGLKSYERGAKRMWPMLLERIAMILGVRISAFFRDDRVPVCAFAARDITRLCRYGRDSKA